MLAEGNVMVDRKINGTDNLLRGSDLLAGSETGEGLTPTFPCVPRPPNIRKFPMHCVGWVYRNVRACNVLRSGKIGKLDDLQYAKCMDPKTTHELRRAPWILWPARLEPRVTCSNRTYADPSAMSTSARLDSILYTTWSLSGGLRRE
ncbi:hypothetical protein PISMIDRAFT_18710 [Pisolithus microcarpus 441]|uniref:Unplaced genomic scaffold scaffold_394, whole genome shotgun sequence n=1 Tax=Pisolithus microcarpus 441 TaxID=765257 RepID=A0A0C9YX89_9AGAM|nr:hypothetical protein PISMIDRAFT_18710 [Pisolithus microcarpus 441]